METKPKSLFMEYEGQVEKEKLHKFLAAVAPDVHRIKGFCDLKETGWTQVDVVGSLIDYKECGAFERSQLVFISKNRSHGHKKDLLRLGGACGQRDEA